MRTPPRPALGLGGCVRLAPSKESVLGHVLPGATQGYVCLSGSRHGHDDVYRGDGVRGGGSCADVMISSHVRWFGSDGFRWSGVCGCMVDNTIRWLRLDG